MFHWRRVFENTIIVFCTIGVSLICSELILRTWFPSPTIPIPDDILGIRAHPGGDNDSRGYRNVEALAQADVVVLGDSQTYGFGVDRADSWPAQLHAYTGTPVYQMAYNQWGPAQYRALFSDALALKPKTIVVALYAGNDILDAVDRVYRSTHWQLYRSPEFRYSFEVTDQFINAQIALDNGYARGTFGHTFVRWKRAAQRSSQIYELLDSVISAIWWRSPFAETYTERETRLNTLLKANPSMGIRISGETPTILSPSYRYSVVDLSNPTTAEGWRLTKRFLSEMQRESADAQTHFILAFIPTKEMVYLEAARLTHASIPGFTAYEKAERDLASSVSEFCTSQKIDCVFPLGAMSSELAENIPLYRKNNDGHPLPEGYRVIAQTVKEHLDTKK